MRIRSNRFISAFLSAVMCIAMLLSVTPISAFAVVGYGTGDWSNGVGWWSQGQSMYDGVRAWGCLIVAQAKMLVLSGVASQNAGSFNPDVWYIWEYNNGYVNDGMYTLSYAGPQTYASGLGKSLTYEGVTHTSDNTKVWENINAGKYSILRTRDNGGSHYVLVNNGASIETGRIRVFQSWDSESIPGTRDWTSTTSEILTYSGFNPPIPPENLGNDFYAYISKKDTGVNLAAKDNNVEIPSGGNDNYDPKQIWHFTRASEGYYRISNEYDGRRLDAWGMYTEVGTNIGVYDANDSDAQKWYIYSGGHDGGYMIAPVYCDLRVDVAGNSIAEGTNIRLWSDNGSAAESFQIRKISDYKKPSKPAAVMVECSVSRDNVMSVSWNASPLTGSFDARVYDVYIYKDSANGTPIHSEMNLKGTSYSYALSSDGTYYVKVAAVNTKYYGWYTFSSVIEAAAEARSLLGDMDGDDEITVGDALLALRIAARLQKAADDDIEFGDVDFDGAVTVGDALVILRVAAKLAGTETLTVLSLSSSFTLYPDCYKNCKINSNYKDAAVKWSSSDTSVVTVDTNGKVTAKSAGTAAVKATVVVVGQKKDVSFSVEVVNPKVVLSPETQSTSFDARSDNRVTVTGHVAYKCPLPTVTTSVNDDYFGDAGRSVTSVTKEVTSGEGVFSGGYFYSYQPGAIKIRYSFSVAGRTYSSTYTCNFTLTRTNPDQGQNIRSATSTSSTYLGMVPVNTTYVITQIAVVGEVGVSGTQVWGYTTYNGASGWTLVEYWP